MRCSMRGTDPDPVVVVVTLSEYGNPAPAGTVADCARVSPVANRAPHHLSAVVYAPAAVAVEAVVRCQMLNPPL